MIIESADVRDESRFRESPSFDNNFRARGELKMTCQRSPNLFHHFVHVEPIMYSTIALLGK